MHPDVCDPTDWSDKLDGEVESRWNADSFDRHIGLDPTRQRVDRRHDDLGFSIAVAHESVPVPSSLNDGRRSTTALSFPTLRKWLESTWSGMIEACLSQ